MPFGKAPIAEASTIDALLRRRWSHRGPVPTGLLSVLTALCWGAWIYLALPLLGLLLWALGIQRFTEEIRDGGYLALRVAFISYSSILLAIIAVLGAWIVWNVVRYGGAHDRRNFKRPQILDEEVAESFHIDNSLLVTLREERRLRLDVDRDDCVLVVRDRPAPVTSAGPLVAQGGGKA